MRFGEKERERNTRGGGGGGGGGRGGGGGGGGRGVKEGSLVGDLEKEGQVGDGPVALYIFNVKRGLFQQRFENHGPEHRGKSACQ